MKSFAFIWLDRKGMPSWPLFYGSMKAGVELSFEFLLAFIWPSRSASASDLIGHWRFTETPYNSSR
jgi:hypothetical protein